MAVLIDPIDQEDYESDIENENDSHRVWISDITDILDDVIIEYSRMDARLEQLRMYDLVYGIRTRGLINDDIDIRRFIKAFIDELNYIIDKINQQGIEVVDDNYYKRLVLLDEDKLYSRIATIIA